MNEQDRRDIFSTFVSVIDYTCVEHGDKVMYTDKYIIYHISLVVRQLARQFCKNPSEQVKQQTVELLNHFEERRQEIKTILLENHGVSEVPKEN